MFTRDWHDDVAEDIHAMRHARTWSGVERIRRGMQGLGRWTGDAQRAYAELCVRWGHEPSDLRRPTHQVYRVTRGEYDDTACYCDATADHIVGKERTHQPSDPPPSETAPQLERGVDAPTQDHANGSHNA